MSGSYRVAPIFVIRMAGVAFEPVERLATPQTSAAVRELLIRQAEFTAAKAEVDISLRSRTYRLPEPLFRAWRRAIRTGVMPPAADLPSRAFTVCWECAEKVAHAEARLDESLNRDMERARAALLDSARSILPGYLIFATGGVQELIAKLLEEAPASGAPLPARKKSVRARERHLLLYLQRICAKNDTLSAFGPAGWGRAEKSQSGLAFDPTAGISQRETFLERWTAHGAAAAMNADPDIRLDLSPRVHPSGRIEDSHFVFSDTGEIAALDDLTRDVLRRCDGRTPAHLLGAEVELLENLAQQQMIRWEVEVPALDPHAFDTLVADVSRWRESPARARWLDRLQPIGKLATRLAQTQHTSSRLEVIEEARARLEELGAAPRSSDRSLYSAGNPIGEECFRDCDFRIDPELINEVAIEAAPWIDLWRDCYAFVASRVAVGLRQLVQTAPRESGALSLPAFIRHCEVMKMPLTGPALVGLAHAAFQEVKQAFRERMAGRTDAAEWQLTTEDCHFVRQTFEYPSFDEYTYPSADLQLSARSVEAIARGECRWIIAELHPPVALLHHGFYWSCPDKEGLRQALASTAKGRPSFHFGFFAADFTATTSVRFLDAMPGLTSFVAPHRADPDWRVIPPAEVEVYVEEESGDVCLRARRSRESLGSFARAWVIPLGFHPFFFGRAPHMPRLCCGKVIVQRRSWTINLGELSPGNYTGVSRHLVLAIERLRAARDLPRFVYIRPTEQALRRSGAEGRDKDTKPVFIDLESYLFLEVFYRWLSKSGEIEATEMLPDPDHLFWREADGRRSFEMRTLIVPRE